MSSLYVHGLQIATAERMIGIIKEMGFCEF